MSENLELLEGCISIIREYLEIHKAPQLYVVLSQLEYVYLNLENLDDTSQFGHK